MITYDTALSIARKNAGNNYIHRSYEYPGEYVFVLVPEKEPIGIGGINELHILKENGEIGSLNYDDYDFDKLLDGVEKTTKYIDNIPKN